MGLIGASLGILPERFGKTDLPGQIATAACGVTAWYYGLITLRTEVYSYHLAFQVSVISSVVDITDSVLARHKKSFLYLGWAGDLKPVVRGIGILSTIGATWMGSQASQWLLPPITLAWAVRESLFDA